MNFTQNNMNGGVISPWLDVRGDLDKFRNSLRKCENFICTPYGGIRRRMGTEHVAPAKGVNRLISYQRTSIDGYVLELGDKYLRVHRDGTRIEGVEVATPWSEEEVFEVQYVKINNVNYFAHINHPPQELIYETDSVWSLVEANFDHPAFRDFQFDGTELSVTPNNVGTITESVNLNATSSNDDSVSSGLLNVSGAWTVDISLLSFPDDTGSLTLQNSTDGGVSFVDITSFSSAGTYTGIEPSGVLRLLLNNARAIGSLEVSNDVLELSRGDSVNIISTGSSFTDDMIGSEVLLAHNPDITEVKLPLFADFAGFEVLSPSLVVSGEWRLFTSGTWRGTIIIEESDDNGRTWETTLRRTGNADRNLAEIGEVSTARLMRLRYEASGGSDNAPYGRLEIDSIEVEGRVLITSVTNSGRAEGIVTEAIYSSEPTDLWKEQAWSNKHGFPAAITWHESRLWFGGTRTDSSTIWASRTDDFFNFRDGTDDDNAFQRTMGTITLTNIVWLASSSNLFIGTTGEEWLGRSDADSGVITPSSFFLRRIANSGSEYIAPIFAGASLIHVQREGRSLLQLGYDAGSASEDGYAPLDLNQLAPHVTLGGVKTIAYQAIRDKIVWATTGNGILIGLTYDRSQNIAGWHTHTTAGEFGSVAVVYEEGNEDSIYLSVVREGVHTIERMRVDQYNIIENGDDSEALYLDAALVRRQDEGSVITGLEHLDGRTISVTSDGKFVGEHLVCDGAVELLEPVREYKVGLRYTSIMETLPFTFDAGDGSSVGRYKRPSCAMMRVYRSVTCEVSQSAGGERRWEEMRQEWRAFNDLGLEEGDNEQGFLEDWSIPLSSSHDTDARLSVRISDPFPLNILSAGAKTELTQ
ncbi:hypothetical protein OAI07_01360 [Akkermansiaceae bacterium]|nr:hypothetical protein [Akkermansiaceae bacterium]